MTIEDNETQVRFESSSYSASEGDGSVSLVVQRIGMGMGTVTVDYAVNGGTATRNTDYSVADGTLTWSDGDTANKTIRISLTDDPVAERTETVVLTLSNVTSNGEETPLGDPASAVLSITDNDDAGFVVEPSAGSLTVREGGAAAAATVALTSRPLADVTVSFETPSRVTVRTANTADSTRLVFTPSNWNISQTVELLAVDDAEEQETVTLTVTARTQSLDNNYDNLSDTLDVTIEDNDGQSTGGGGSGALGAGWMLILIGLGSWFMGMRALVSNVVSEDYVQYAELGGVDSRRILSRYVMRNALVPQMTGLAMSLGAIFNGAIITEEVFGYPGVGSLLVDAVHAGDYSLVLGITTISIVSVATAVLIIDLAYPFLDPRVKLA